MCVDGDTKMFNSKRKEYIIQAFREKKKNV